MITSFHFSSLILQTRSSGADASVWRVVIARSARAPYSPAHADESRAALAVFWVAVEGSVLLSVREGSVGSLWLTSCLINGHRAGAQAQINPRAASTIVKRNM